MTLASTCGVPRPELIVCLGGTGQLEEVVVTEIEGVFDDLGPLEEREPIGQSRRVIVPAILEGVHAVDGGKTRSRESDGLGGDERRRLVPIGGSCLCGHRRASRQRDIDRALRRSVATPVGRSPPAEDAEILRRRREMRVAPATRPR